MTASSTMLVLVLLLATSVATTVHGEQEAGAGAGSGQHGVTHILLYMHEVFADPNATAYEVVPSRQGGNTTFGKIVLLDDELRDGPDPSNSSLLGRFQGIVAMAGLVSPPGAQTAITFAFTAGEHIGSTLVMLGSILDFQKPFERAVVGGTGAFRFARGYCVLSAVSKYTTAASIVYEVNLFLKDA